MSSWSTFRSVYIRAAACNRRVNIEFSWWSARTCFTSRHTHTDKQPSESMSTYVHTHLRCCSNL